MKEGTISDKISRFLFSYRNIPHSTTGTSPAELMFGRRLRSQLDLLKPSTEARVEESQQRQKRGHDQHTRDRYFTEGDTVYVRNYGQGETWLPGTISEVTGPVSYMVDLADGKRIKRHQDQIRKRFSSPDIPFIPQSVKVSGSEEAANAPLAHQRSDTSSEAQEQTESQSQDAELVEISQSERPQSERRYPTRVRRPPDRY